MTGLALLIVFQPQPTIDHVAIAELNHVFHRDGSYQASYWLWWRWEYHLTGEYDYYVADWRPFGEVPWPEQGAQEWYDARTKTRRRVVSTLTRESWTRYDKEVEDKRRLPEAERRKLSAKSD